MTEGWEAEPVTIGMSSARTLRLRREGHPDRYLKEQAPTWDRGLDAEAARLAWLAGTALAGRVPKVVAFEPGPPLDRLVTTAVAGGWPPSAFAMGRALREMHDALDPAACPFDMRLDVRLAMAARRVADGAVDVDDFEDEHLGRSPQELLARLHAERPSTEDLVVTHGDWCFPNVLFDGDEWAMVDLAGLGVGCRWYDLGIGVRSAMHNTGPDAADEFFAGYGVAPDDDLTRYYILLDELQ